MILAALNNAEVASWICVVVGVLVLITGLALGIIASTTNAKSDANAKIDEAKKKIEETKDHLESAKTQGLEANTHAASNAMSSAEAAKSALEQVGTIVGSLPEPLRFSGMLVLVGAVLMSVGTIQFGGTSIF